MSIKKRKGLTFIEFMIVIANVAIVVALILPWLDKRNERASKPAESEIYMEEAGSGGETSGSEGPEEPQLESNGTDSPD